MNKKGFTLSELLISMAIIAIVAAVMMPAVTGFFPDKTKMKYMKVYNTLVNTTSEILDDEELYWNEYKDDGSIDKSGLRSMGRPQVSPYISDEHCESTYKFPCIFSKFVNVQGAPTYGTVQEFTGFASGLLNFAFGDKAVQFTTTDGVLWYFTTSSSIEGALADDRTYSLSVNLDVADSKAENNCVFDNDTCKKPNQFQFRIEKDGGVYAADALGMAYLMDPTNMHSAKKDMEVAANVMTKAGKKPDFEDLQKAFFEVTSKK